VEPPGWQDAGMPIDVEALEDEWEEDHHLLARRSRELSQAARETIDRLDAARVVAVDRGRVTILVDGEVVEATLAGTMRGTKAAVGDHVRIRPARHESDLPRIVEVLPRTTVLTRTGDDVVDDERVVVANADAIAVVLAAENLAMGIRFLDRVLVAASVGGLLPMVVVNKVDLLTDRSAVDEVLERYAAIGAEVHATSALTGEGLEALGRSLTDEWTAFTGHSGVGKSALFNRLVPEADREVGAVGRYGGRHTTVSALAMPITALSAWLIDTPGVRSFGLGGLAPRELARHFPELAALRCALDDCIHDGEPGCRLLEAAIHPERLAAYRRLLASLRGEA
jgi:ribosome biogenesis GTPase / thiamine phosphate phosphatase